MEENKYYVPEIGEFCIGFTYEIKGNNEAIKKYFPDRKPDEWIKQEVTVADNFYILYDYLKYLNVRVPYLSKEDIEAEGFEFLKDDERRYIFRKKINYQEGRFSKTIAELLYNPFNNWCLIYIGDEETMLCDFKTIFAGKIKNKSEFGRILKMIGV